MIKGEESFGVDVKCALKIQRREMKAGILREYLLEEITFELDF